MQAKGRNPASNLIAKVFLMLGLWAASSPAITSEVILIGLTGPFSGGSAPMGESMRNGVRLAVREINAIGGIHGKKIQLVERDDESSEALGKKIASELTQIPVAAAIGIVNTGVGRVSVDYYQRAGIPLMIAVSTGPELTRRYAPPHSKENYIFRVSPTLDIEAKFISIDLLRRGLKTIALMADDTPYGDAAVSALSREAAAAGLNLTSIQRFRLSDPDLTVKVSQARRADAQAVVGWGIGPEMATIAKSMHESGWRAPFLGSWTLSMNNFIDGAGIAAEGALMPQTFIQESGVTAKNSFLLSYLREFRVDRIPSAMSAAQGYDGMHLLALAIRQAKSLEGAAIRRALESLEAHYQGAITSYRKPFNEKDHDAITANMLMMGRINRGRVDYAYREEKTKGVFLRLKAKEESAAKN